MLGKGIKKKLSFVIGLGMIFITVTSAVAVGNVEEVKSFINHSIKITFNGGLFQPKEADGTPIKPIIYNGRTYLPVRTISELTGMKVDWDANTSTVILESNANGIPSAPVPVSTSTPVQSTVPEGKYNERNPAPLNVTQKLKYEYNSDDGKYYRADINITFTDIKTGNDAMSFVKSLGIDTSDLKPELELVAVKQTFEYSNVSTNANDGYVSTWYNPFYLVLSGDYSVRGRYDYFEGGLGKVFALDKFSNGSKGTYSGWVIYSIMKGETESRVGFCKDNKSISDVDSHVWFKLTK